MDLTKFDTVAAAETGTVLKLRHPATEEVLPGMTVTILGMDSKKGQELQRAKQQAAINRVLRGKKGQSMDAAKLAEASVEDLATLTTAWTGIEEGEVAVEFNYENVLAIYKKYPWIKEQVSEAVNDRGSFLGE